MKNTILLVTALGLLAACESTKFTGKNVAVGKRINIESCDILVIPDDCSNPQGNANNPIVTFNKQSLVVAPRNVCAKPSSKIEFRITPNAANLNPPGSVAVIPKDIADTWLTGTNFPMASKIEITVPSYVPLDKTKYYEYTIVSNLTGVVSCVDPRVHVY